MSYLPISGIKVPSTQLWWAKVGQDAVGCNPQTPEGAHHRVRPGQQIRPGSEPPDRRLEEGRVPQGSDLRGQGLRDAVAAAGAGGLPEGLEGGGRAPGLASGSPRPLDDGPGPLD